MKILIISHYFPPLNSVASQRTYSWAKYWNLSGHDVHILTSKKNTQDHDLEYDLSKFKINEVGNRVVDFLEQTKKTASQSKNTNIKSNSFKKLFTKRGAFSTIRMPDQYDFLTIPSYQSAAKKEWDVVITSFGPYYSHIVGYFLKKNKKTKIWVADYRDLWTQHFNYKGLFPFTILERFIENRVNSLADIITTVSNPLKEKIQQQTTQPNKVYTIENGFDPADSNYSVPERKKKGKIRILYTGTIYEGKWDITPLLDAIIKIKKTHPNLNSKLEVLFYGSNSYVLKNEIERYNLMDIITLNGQIKRENVLALQKETDILLFLGYSGPGSEGILTGKIFEYIFSKATIWCIGINNKSDVGQLVIESNSGINFGKNTDLIYLELEKLLLLGKPPKRIINLEKFNRFNRKLLAEKLLALVTSKMQNT